MDCSPLAVVALIEQWVGSFTAVNAPTGGGSLVVKTLTRLNVKEKNFTHIVRDTRFFAKRK